MVAPLLLAALVAGSPVPKDAAPAGPAPRLVEFTPDADGKVRVTAMRTETRKVQEVVAVQKQVEVNGRVETRVEHQTRDREVPVKSLAKVELAELKSLVIYTADGKEADRALALKKLADGGTVVVSADGKKVDPKYLKLFRDDTLVLVSPELVTAHQIDAPAPIMNPQVIGPHVKLIPLPPPLPPMADGGGGAAPPPPQPPVPGVQRVPGRPG